MFDNRDEEHQWALRMSKLEDELGLIIPNGASGGYRAEFARKFENNAIAKWEDEGGSFLYEKNYYLELEEPWKKKVN